MEKMNKWKRYIFRLFLFLCIFGLSACNGSKSNDKNSKEEGLSLQSTNETDDIEVIDSVGDVGKYTSSALDNNGNPPMISYFENLWATATGNLKLAYWNGTNYETMVIEEGGIYLPVGQYTSIDVDSRNYTHISYSDATASGGLGYAKVSPGEPPQLEDPDVEFWAGVGATTIKLDLNELPWISYLSYSYNLDGPYRIKIAYKDEDEVWHEYIIEELGVFTLPLGFTANGFPSLGIRADGKKMISYYDLAYDPAQQPPLDRRNLKFACGVPGDWEIYEVDTEGDVGAWTSLALYDPDPLPPVFEQPYISYYDYDNRAIKLATGDCDANCNCTFTTEIVLQDSLTNTNDGCSNVDGYPCYFGPDNSLTIDNSGTKYIAFIDSTNLDLKYAKKVVGGTWSVFLAHGLQGPGAGGVGFYPSIALSPTELFIANYRSYNYYVPLVGVTRDGDLNLYSEVLQ